MQGPEPLGKFRPGADSLNGRLDILQPASILAREHIGTIRADLSDEYVAGLLVHRNALVCPAFRVADVNYLAVKTHVFPFQVEDFAFPHTRKKGHKHYVGGLPVRVVFDGSYEPRQLLPVQVFGHFQGTAPFSRRTG